MAYLPVSEDGGQWVCSARLSSRGRKRLRAMDLHVPEDCGQWVCSARLSSRGGEPLRAMALINRCAAGLSSLALHLVMRRP